jgi:coenzyme PQQ precursor peptide PqqA
VIDVAVGQQHRVNSLAWAGDSRVRPRTQSSIAVSPDGERWLLLNASPDIRQQIQANPQMHPREGLRHSPIHAVLLTNGDVDHVAGLLTLREGQPFTLYATPGVQQEPAFPVRRDCDARLRARPDAGIARPGQGADGAAAVPLRKKWAAPIVSEICVGMEVTSYESAEIDTFN